MYAAIDDPYCYPGSRVLRNKLDIRDAAALEAFEHEVARERAAEPLPAGKLSVTHFRIHAFRDGNGRAQLSFTTLLSHRAGHPLHLERLDSEAFLAAMIKSFYGNERLLAAQLRGVLASSTPSRRW